MRPKPRTIANTFILTQKNLSGVFDREPFKFTHGLSDLDLFQQDSLLALYLNAVNKLLKPREMKQAEPRPSSRQGD